MSEPKQDTRQKILAAAEVVFHENGFKGTRTTVIAKKAGVSRTMLHYYFRTKEDIFYEVLHSSFGFFLQHAQQLMGGDNDLKQLINKLVGLLCDVLSEKPGLATFIVNILNASPELITGLPLIQQEDLPSLFELPMQRARERGEIQSPISGEDLLLNIYGLCAMPYLSASLIRFKSGRNPTEMQSFYENRKEMIKKFVWNGLQN